MAQSKIIPGTTIEAAAKGARKMAKVTGMWINPPAQAPRPKPVTQPDSPTAGKITQQALIANLEKTTE